MCLWTVRTEVLHQEVRMESHVPLWLNFIISKTVSRCWDVRAVAPRWDLTGNQSPFFQTILQALPRPGLSSWRFGNCCAIARVSDSVFYFQPDCASLMMVKKNNSLMQMKRWGMSRRTSYLQRLESDCETKMCIAYIVYYICLPRCANILYFDAAKFSIKQFHWYILLFLLSDNGKNMKKWLKRVPLRLHN